MSKINLAILHGIGVTGPGYSNPLSQNIKKSFQNTLRDILKTNKSFSGEIEFIEIVWDDILASNQKKLGDIFETEFKKRRESSLIEIIITTTILFIISSLILLFSGSLFFYWIISLCVLYYFHKAAYKLRTRFAAEFISDIIGYRNDSAYKKIKERILERITQKLKIDEKRNLSFVSHSLGTIIASDFIYDRQKEFGSLHEDIKLNNFFTLGSPLALFSLEFGPEMFKSPIKLEDENGRWVNIFDKDDLIAYPLKPLNEVYDKLILKDKEINTGLFGDSHIRYFPNKKLADIIGTKLAIDWLSINDKLTNDEIKCLYESYDKNLKIC